MPPGQHRLPCTDAPPSRAREGPHPTLLLQGAARGAPKRWKLLLLLTTARIKVPTTQSILAAARDRTSRGSKGGRGRLGLKPLYSCPQHLLQDLANTCVFEGTLGIQGLPPGLDPWLRGH